MANEYTSRASDLKNVVLIGKLSVTNWEAKKKARAIETKAELDSGAKHGTISARKSLLPGAEALDDIIKHAAAMRTWWNQVSQPWFDNGMRAYNVAGHIDIQMAYGDMARHRDALVDKFMADYPALREQARFDLNDLFDEADYPLPAVVRARFTCSFEYMTLPNTEDFRVLKGLGEEEIERLQSEAEARTHARIAEAQQTTVTRVLDALRIMADRLNTYTQKEMADEKGARYYDSWVENVKEMAGLLPQLNLTNDPRLDATAKEIADTFAHPAAHYKTNMTDRLDASAKAADLAKRLGALFG